MKPHLLALTVVLLGWSGTELRGEESSVKLSAAPEAVRKTFTDETKPTKVELINKTTEDGETTYWVKTAVGGKHYEIRVDDQGVLLSKELDVADAEIKFADCPAAVKATFARESNNGKFEEIGKGVRYGVVVYDGVCQLGGKEYSFVVSENGTLIEKMLVVIEDEIDLTLCPAAVQKSLKDHAPGGKVVGVVKSSGLGGNVYEADVQVGKLTYLIEVTEGGALISKSLLDDGEDDEEMDPKDAKKPAAPPEKK